MNKKNLIKIKNLKTNKKEKALCLTGYSSRLKTKGFSPIRNI